MPTVFPSSPSNGDTYIPPQIQKLLASDRANSDQFGKSVALSADGLTAIVGSNLEDASPNTNNGAAYVFTYSAGAWTEQQKLLASDAASNENFGSSVSLSEDGNTAIVGATGEDTSPNTDNGAAYVFTRSGSTWTQQQKLLASDSATDDTFGTSVALSSDGNTAIVGAEEEDASPNAGNGAAYIFTRSGGTWTQQTKLLASDRANNDNFGKSVALSSDGNTALIGAYNKLTQGAVYVFTRSSSVWTQQQKLTASDALAFDEFGYSVALSSDGDTALIGATGEDTSPNTDNGAAYVFTRSAGVWTQQQKLLASDAAGSDVFGNSVSLSADGNTALIAAYGENNSPYTNNGAAYIFTRSGSTWTQQTKLTAPDAATNDNFGYSVSISANSNTAIIGAWLEDTSPNTNNGVAYTYNFNNIGTKYSYNSTQSRWEVVTSTNVKKAPTTHLFTSSVASWTIPTGARIVHAVCIGGGGGGGGGGYDNPGGAGGGGGGMSIFTYNLIAGYKTTAVITVGAGGTGGTASYLNTSAVFVLGTAGATGGTSSFKLADSGNAGTLSAFGGGGGDTAASSASTSATTGGSGGFGMWVGGVGGAGGTALTASNNGVSATSATLQTSPGGGGGGGGNFTTVGGSPITYAGDGGAGASALTFGTAVGTAISKTDANLSGSPSSSNFVNTYYPAKTPPAVVGPGGGGNGGPSGRGSSNASFYGGTGGLYGGGGGGGGSRDTSIPLILAGGGDGGPGAQGCVFITVWYE